MTRFVSTGHLPPERRVEVLVEATYERYRDVQDGDSDVQFAIMSVTKPFLFALVCDAIGPAEVRDRVGVNAA